MYTDKEIRKALHSSNRKIDFRYELLDRNNRRIRDLTNVVNGSIDYGMLREIKRTANFTLIEDGQDIDYLNDRIKPYMRLKVSNKWIEFPLGVFMLSSPTRADEILVKRDIEAYDLSLILRDDKFIDRYTILEGTNYYEAIVDILDSAGITQYNLERTEDNLPRTLEFDPGTEKINVINNLLNQLNYTPIYVDENGYFTARKYVSPSDRSIDYEYLDNEQSVTLIGAEEELDTFNVPNAFSVVRTNEEEEPLISTFINDNPKSVTSTISRGRQIVDYREIDDIASQQALDDYVERIAFEANQIYGRIRFRTALMPVHGYGNVLRFRYSPLDIDNKYLELNWSMKLSTNGTMEHELRQVISL